DDLEVDAVLVDSRTAVADGGTGVTFDWESASVSLSTLAPKPLIVAGGLSAINVAEAIGVLRPFGVDVASGVGAAGDKRRKDPDKLRDFILNAKNAVPAL